MSAPGISELGEIRRDYGQGAEVEEEPKTTAVVSPQVLVIVTSQRMQKRCSAFDPPPAGLLGSSGAVPGNRFIG